MFVLNFMIPTAYYHVWVILTINPNEVEFLEESK